MANKEFNLPAALNTNLSASDFVRIIDNKTSKKISIAEFILFLNSQGTLSTDHTLLTNIGTNSHAVIDTHLANVANPHSVTKAQVGLTNVANIKNNLAGTSAPAVTDDSSAGYSIGSNWYVTTNDKAYVLLDSTVGSAVWIETTAGATGGISDIVQDLTPQLGGNLDVNGKTIASASAGNIVITPDSTGDLILDGIKWPQADGTSGQVLKTDGSGQTSWVTKTDTDTTDHTALSNIGTNSHAAIDTHIANSDIHRSFKLATSAPGSPSEGDMWLNTTTQELSIYTNSVWEKMTYKSELASTAGDLTLTAGNF